MKRIIGSWVAVLGNLKIPFVVTIYNDLFLIPFFEDFFRPFMANIFVPAFVHRMVFVKLVH